jgi:hypothetical protein
MEKRYKYVVDVLAFTQGFDAKMKIASGEAKKLAGEMEGVETANAGMTSGIGSLTRGLGTFAVAIGGPLGALALLKSSISAIEGPGDKFEEIIGGGKEAVYEFQKAIATFDFSNFIRNIVDGYERGAKFTEMLDELADRTAYNDYIIAGLKAQSTELQETIKNRTLDIALRRKYAQDRNNIEQKILDRTQELAQKAFILEKQQWEERNKMSTDAAIKLYEGIDSLSADVQTRLQEAYTYARKLFGAAKGTEMVISGEKGRGLVKEIPEEVIQSYGRYLQLLDKGEKDVLIKLFNAYKNIDTVRYESQRSYNLSVRETSMLLEAEERALGNIIDRVKSMSKIPGIKDPLLGAEAIGSGLSHQLVGTNNPYKKWSEDKGMKDFEDSQRRQIDLIHELAGAFTNTFASADGGLKAMAKSMLQTIKQMVAKMAGYLAVFGVLKAVMPGSDLLVGGFKGFLKTVGGSFIPGMASGGIAYGPTVANIGEYPTARVNPEVVAPLSNLRALLNINQAAIPDNAKLVVDAGGNMLAYFNYQERKLNNYR